MHYDSYYDFESEEFVVKASLAEFNGGAILPMHSNEGEWESQDELVYYLAELLDLPVEEGKLPPFRYEQSGRIARWNQFEERWTESRTGNLIWDAISADDGVVYVPDASVEQEALGSHCDEKTSYDSQGTELLYMHQCSLVDLAMVYRSDTSGDYIALRGESKTQIDEIGWKGERSGMSFHCTPTGCDFRVVLIIADRMGITNYHYYDETPHPSTQSNVVYDVDSYELGYQYPSTEVEGMMTSNGVCGQGTVVKDDGLHVDKEFLDTKAGNYDPNDPVCLN